MIAEGKLDATGWVFGEVELDEVRQVRAEGKARTFEDWPEQGPAAVETVRLGAEG